MMKNSENQPLREKLAALRILPPQGILDFAWQELHWKAPSSDHVLLGLAVLANQKGLVRTLVSKNPELLKKPCIVRNMVRLTTGFPTPAIHDDTPLLLAAISMKAWGVGEVLVEQARLAASGPAALWPGAFSCTIDSALAASHVNVARPALRFAKTLLDAGAPLLEADEEGMTPFGATLNNLINYPPWGEANGPFRANVEVMAFFLSCLPDMDAAAFAKGTDIHDSIASDLEIMLVNNEGEQPVDRASAGMVWFRDKTGINLPSYQECLVAWLLAHGLDIEPVNAFAQNHVPSALAFLERRRLQASLPEITREEGSRPSRFRL